MLGSHTAVPLGEIEPEVTCACRMVQIVMGGCVPPSVQGIIHPAARVNLNACMADHVTGDHVPDEDEYREHSISDPGQAGY